MWQDFKEAARLSAESKAQSAEAEAASSRAKELRMRAAGLESDETTKANDVARLQDEVRAGKRVLALAKWRCVKVSAYLPLHPLHVSTHSHARVSSWATLAKEADRGAHFDVNLVGL